MDMVDTLLLLWVLWGITHTSKEQNEPSEPISDVGVDGRGRKWRRGGVR